MRTIHVEEGLRLRFPGRDSEFSEGVEIGMIAALMGLGHAVVTRKLSASSVEQAECLARKLGYYLAEQRQSEDSVLVSFHFGHARPKLRLVHSRDDLVLEAATG